MGDYTKVPRNNNARTETAKPGKKKPADNNQYGFTEDASLAMAGLDNSSTGFKIPDEMTSKNKK